MSRGKVNLEVTLDREVNYHGQDLPVHILINNTSKKAVKCIRVRMTNFQTILFSPLKIDCLSLSNIFTTGSSDTAL